MYRLRSFLLRVLVLLPIALPASVLSQVTQECSIIGELRVVRGSFPNKRIQVNLETRGATAATVYADNEGKFFFPGLQGNLYHVVINDDDFQAVDERVAVTPLANCTAILMITLNPKSAASTATAEPNRPGANAHMMDNDVSTGKQGASRVSGANPYVVNQSEYAKLPPKALKEFKAGLNSDQKGHPEEAISHYQKVLKMAPDFYPARNNMGTAYLSRGDFESAETEFRNVIQANNSDAAAYFNLGNAFLLTKRYDEASRSIGEGLQKQPNSALGLFLLGSVHARTHHRQEAEKSLRRALEIDAGLSNAHLALVNLYVEEGRVVDAIGELKEFLRMAPNDALTPKAREVLHRLEAQSATQAKSH